MVFIFLDFRLDHFTVANGAGFPDHPHRGQVRVVVENIEKLVLVDTHALIPLGHSHIYDAGIISS